MKPAQKKLLKAAMEMLNAIGAKYAIVVEEETFGELEVVKPKSKRVINRKRWASISVEIERRLQAMPGNSIEEFLVPEGETFHSFQAYLCYKATQLFGSSEEYFTTRDKDSGVIQLYRGPMVSVKSLEH